MAYGGLRALLAASVFTLAPVPAQAQTVEDLQRQIDELKAALKALTEAQAAANARAVVPASPAPTAPPVAAAPAAAAPGQPVSPQPAPVLAAAPAPAAPAPKSKAWYEKIQVRGYVQMRSNEIISGDKTAPAGVSRLRSVHDSGVTDNGNVTLRRVRMVLQGDITDRVSFYLQPDFASAVSNQSGGERREGFGQLRDAYVDVHFGKSKQWKVRLGQSKVPFGWENLQSSSNRLALDRTDAINAPVPGERDLGAIVYYTPPSVQKIWDRLGKDGQKLFGNYGAFGVAVFNGQGINRTEQNNALMKVAMATWPFELDGLGSAFAGQVFEIGGSAMLNKVQPEVRAGGVSTRLYDDNHAGIHAMLYPQPFGIQAEWTWGRAPQFDRATQTIQERDASGGYVQAMYRIDESPVGPMIPYARWQRYRGGWKAATNAPRLETDEYELGVEWQPMKAIEVTLAYAHMKRTEADERRLGRAEGSLIRTQVQFSY